jgi:hypothetical protein
VWFDVLGTERGALALWVEQTKQGDGTVFAAALAPDGKLRGVPVRVTRGVSSWHAIATSSGVLLAVALTSETGAQSLELHRLDELARPSQAPVALSTGRVAGDLELVRAGRGYLCAWTEREAGEPTVRAAAVDDLGKIIFTKTIASQPGGATLLALVAGPSGVVYAWEERRKRAAEFTSANLVTRAPGSGRPTPPRSTCAPPSSCTLQARASRTLPGGSFAPKRSSSGAFAMAPARP